MLFGLTHSGEVLSLACAFVWAIAIIFFKKSGESVSPLGLNFVKNVVGLALLVPTVLFLKETLIVKAPWGDYLLLLASGVIGIGVADTLFFRSLNLIGAGLSAIVDCLYSPFVIGLSILFLGESMSSLQLVGVLFIISAILAISLQKNNKSVSRRNLIWGILLGVFSMALMAIGIVMVKPLLGRSPLLWVIMVRLFAGCLSLGIMILFCSDCRKIGASILTAENWRFMLPGSFLGAYLALILWIAGMKYTQASTASALNQTSSIFVFVLAAIFLKEPINRIRVIGIILAFAGVIMVCFG
jgi:drug/metabolite transporter (DMT)-like permease